MQGGAGNSVAAEEIGEVMLVVPLQLIEVDLQDPRHLGIPPRAPVDVAGTNVVVASIPKGSIVVDDLVFQMELPPSFAMSVGFFDRGATVDVVVTIVSLPDGR